MKTNYYKPGTLLESNPMNRTAWKREYVNQLVLVVTDNTFEGFQVLFLFNDQIICGEHHCDYKVISEAL